jgi:hypothetical protein
MFGNLVANPKDATAAASCIRQNTRHRAAAVETHDDSIVFFAREESFEESAGQGACWRIVLAAPAQS